MSRRAPFNTTLDLILGPNTGAPGTIAVANVPCRVVGQTRISFFHFPYQLIAWWITTQNTAPNLATTNLISGGTATVDWGMADWVAVPSGAAAVYGVVDCQMILDVDEPGGYYLRYLVVPLPFPYW